MKFIRFGDSLLNLEQVIYFHDATDGDTGPTIYAYLNGPFPVRRECFGDAEAMQARFQELSDMLIGAEPVPRKGVMKASEALNVPDIVGKRIAMSVMDDFGILTGIKQANLSKDVVFEFKNNTVYVDPNNLIEVIDYV